MESEQSDISNAETPSSDDSLVSGYRIARLGDRLIAVILDTIFLAAAFALIGVWTASQWGGLTGSGFSMEGKPALIAISIAVLFSFLYYLILEGIFGVTLGKAIIGVQVRKKDGSACGMSASFLRNLFRLVDAIGLYIVGFLVAIFSKLRQRIGDHVAKTIVVERKFSRALQAVFVLLWLACIVGGIWGAYIIHSGIPKTAPVQTPSDAAISLGITPALNTSGLASGDLKLVNFGFLQSKDGQIRPEAPYKSGEKVYTKYNVTGFTTDSEGKINLLLNVVVFDPSGLPLYVPWKNEIQQTVEKADTPVDGYFNFDIPLYAPSGTYKIVIKVQDAVKNVATEFIQTLKVEAEPFASSGQLGFYDCGLSLSKDGPLAKSPIIKTGGTIYSYCKIAGMRFYEERPNINISLKVTGPGGKVILDKPDFINDNNPYFYHPHTFFEKISAWVSLPSDAPRGKYSWRYTMIDRVSNKTADYEMKFEVK